MEVVGFAIIYLFDYYFIEAEVIAAGHACGDC
jgi:hypothetical protein